MTTKAEKREKLKLNRSKMTVSNRSIFTLDRIIKDKIHENISIHSHKDNRRRKSSRS